MSFFVPFLAAPDRVSDATLWLSRILKMTEAVKKIKKNGKEIAEGLRRRAVWMQPQWPPVTAVGSTVGFCLCSPSFPASPPTPPFISKKLRTGSLMADFTQEILQRSVEKAEAATRCVWGWKNGSPSTVSKAIKMCRLAWCYKQGKTRVTEGPVWANLVTKEITGLNHNKFAKQEPNPY